MRKVLTLFALAGIFICGCTTDARNTITAPKSNSAAQPTSPTAQGGKPPTPSHVEPSQAQSDEHRTKGFSLHPGAHPQHKRLAHRTASTNESEDAAAWHKSLPLGLIDYHVDTTMELAKPSQVTVTIHGENAPATAQKAGTVTDKLQVSPHMVVELTQPDNPDGFTINPPDTQPAKLIASDGATAWSWQVTPQHLGDLKLHIAAFVLYEDDPNNRLSYATYDTPVTVHSVTVRHESKSAWEWIQEHPGQALAYLLPGGAGAAILGKLIDIWRKRRKRNTAPDKEDDQDKEDDSDDESK